jgi:hypothetical protein
VSEKLGYIASASVNAGEHVRRGPAAQSGSFAQNGIGVRRGQRLHEGVGSQFKTYHFGKLLDFRKNSNLVSSGSRHPEVDCDPTLTHCARRDTWSSTGR